jgi:hypothetical protein
MALRDPGARRNAKHQIPNPKQIPSTKFQTTDGNSRKYGHPEVFWSLVFEICLRFGACDL